MDDLIIVVVILGVFFYIISIIMDLKAKNFIYEKQNILFMLIIVIILNLVGYAYSYFNEYPRTYTMMINVVMAIAILGGYLIFQKNRIYYFKGMDYKLVKEYKNDIKQIIGDYRDNYLGSRAEITLLRNRVVFEKVSKEHAEECLSLVGNFLDENRRKYTLKDYLLYFIKGYIMPIAIVILVAIIIKTLISF